MFFFKGGLSVSAAITGVVLLFVIEKMYAMQSLYWTTMTLEGLGILTIPLGISIQNIKIKSNWSPNLLSKCFIRFVRYCSGPVDQSAERYHADIDI